jgi:hypothetical protein
VLREQGAVCGTVARRGAPARDFERRYSDIGRDTIRERAAADAMTRCRSWSARSRPRRSRSSSRGARDA